MANNYLEFSFMVNDLSERELDWFKNLEEKKYYGIYDNNSEVFFNDEYDLGFSYEAEKSSIWFHSEEYGNPDSLAILLQSFLKNFRPSETIGFSWAYYCSKLRLNEQGGGACRVTATNMEWVDTGMWLEGLAG